MKGLAALAAEWEGCQRCELHQSRQRIVFGSGPQQAKLMIVGEAPGKEEDIKGQPFVGESGKMLNYILEQAGLRRDAIFFTNAVACRPPGNRTPTTDEIKACRPRLLELIYIVDPILIVAAGKVAARALLGHPVTITEKRGEIETISLNGIALPVKYTVLLTLHPSFLLRQPELGQDGWISMVIQDFITARKIINMATMK